MKYWICSTREKKKICNVETYQSHLIQLGKTMRAQLLPQAHHVLAGATIKKKRPLISPFKGTNYKLRNDLKVKNLFQLDVDTCCILPSHRWTTNKEFFCFLDIGRDSIDGRFL